MSVLISTKNPLSTILECVRKVCSSSYPNIEVVINDNASSDNTRTYIERSFPGVVSLNNLTDLGVSNAEIIAQKMRPGNSFCFLTVICCLCIPRHLISCGIGRGFGLWTKSSKVTSGHLDLSEAQKP